jgi:acyl-CoA thioester hydrolase
MKRDSGSPPNGAIKTENSNICFHQRSTMYKKLLTPRISEVNGARHIGHHVIPIWLEEGFLEIIRIFTPDIRGETTLIMKSIHIDFIHEIFLGEDVEVMTGIKKIGNTSFVLDQKIYQSHKLFEKVTPTFINFDYGNKKTKPIPPDVRERLEAHMLTD